MRLFRQTTLFLLLLWLFLVPAARGGKLPPLTGLFYQPHTTDLAQDVHWWRQTLEKLQRQGIQRLYIQWTRHGEVDFLRQRVVNGPALVPLLLDLGDRFHLQIHFGLYADPDFFSRLDQSDKALAVFLKRLRLLSLEQARRLLVQAQDHPSFAGFYLYEEIDDLHWRRPSRQQLLQGHLARTVTSLNHLAPNLPVAISSFFTGQMTPKGYGLLWQRILSQIPLVLLVQDGSGSGLLTREERLLYFNALHTSLDSRPWTAILELFRAQGSTKTFSALPRLQVDPDYLHRLETLTTRPPVGFSLRYLHPFPTDGQAYPTNETSDGHHSTP